MLWGPFCACLAFAAERLCWSVAGALGPRLLRRLVGRPLRQMLAVLLRWSPAAPLLVTAAVLITLLLRLSDAVLAPLRLRGVPLPV